jgi:hypothetical protein
MQGELNIVWDKLLPAFHPKKLKANKEEQTKLKETLSNLNAHPQPATSSAASK